MDMSVFGPRYAMLCLAAPLLESWQSLWRRRQRVKRENIVEPNMNLVKEHFSPSQMRALWGRLATARKQADISIKDAWKDLAGTEDGKTQSKELKGMCNLVKDYALVQWSAFPHNWQTRMCTFLETLKKEHRAEAEIEAFTWGQIVQQHGEIEAEELLRLNEITKIDVTWSKVPRYVRQSRRENIAVTKSSSMETQRVEKPIDEERFGEVSNAMNDAFDPGNLSSFGSEMGFGAAFGFVVDDVPDRSNDKGNKRKKSDPLALLAIKDKASEQKQKKPSAAPKRVKKHQIKQERKEEEEVKDEEKITKGDFLNQGKGPEDPTEEIRKKCLAQSSKLSKLVPKLLFFKNLNGNGASLKAMIKQCEADYARCMWQGTDVQKMQKLNAVCSVCTERACGSR